MTAESELDSWQEPKLFCLQIVHSPTRGYTHFCVIQPEKHLHRLLNDMAPGEGTHFCTCSAEIKNVWSCTSTSVCVF